jgi:hypothetical protein
MAHVLTCFVTGFNIKMAFLTGFYCDVCKKQLKTRIRRSTYAGFFGVIYVRRGFFGYTVLEHGMKSLLTLFL